MRKLFSETGPRCLFAYHWNQPDPSTTDMLLARKNIIKMIPWAYLRDFYLCNRHDLLFCVINYCINWFYINLETLLLYNIFYFTLDPVMRNHFILWLTVILCYINHATGSSISLTKMEIKIMIHFFIFGFMHHQQFNAYETEVLLNITFLDLSNQYLLTLPMLPTTSPTAQLKAVIWIFYEGYAPKHGYFQFHSRFLCEL